MSSESEESDVSLTKSGRSIMSSTIKVGRQHEWRHHDVLRYVV